MNLNSISAHNYANIFLVKTYIAILTFDIIYISETYLDSYTSPPDNNLDIFVATGDCNAKSSKLHCHD